MTREEATGFVPVVAGLLTLCPCEWGSVESLTSWRGAYTLRVKHRTARKYLTLYSSLQVRQFIAEVASYEMPAAEEVTSS